MDAVVKSDRFRIDLDISELADEIVFHLPQSLFHSSETKFLDPAYAGGQFLYAVAKRLLKNGHSKENILGRLYGAEYRPIYANSYKIRGLLGADLQIISTLDQLKEVFHNMKFDVVLGNPPFQNPGKSKGNKLWPKFIMQSVELTKDDGYFALVSPTGWASGGNNIPGNRGVISDVFAKNQIHTIKDANEHFNVGIDIAYFVGQVKKVTKKTDLILTDGKSKVDFRKSEFISPRFNQLDMSITQKVFFGGHEKFDVVSFDRSIKRGTVVESSEPTKKFKFKHYVLGGSTAKNAGFTYLDFNNSPKLDFPKVLFTIGNRYWQPYYDMENACVASQGFAIPIEKKATVKSLKSIFESKVFTYVNFWYQLNMKGFMKTNIAKSLPKLDMTKTWTDKEIYKVFDLNKEEIDHIESTLESVKHG